MPNDLPLLLALSGSLRRESNTTKLMHALAPLVDGRARWRAMRLNEVPPYDADFDGEVKPDGVRALKEAIAEADGLVICSPEYNYGMPGVLKNAIDWASRPAFKSPMKGKPALVITCSPGVFGGARAQAQIRDVLLAVLARPVPRPHLAVPQVDKKLAEGAIADEATRQLMQSGLDELLAQIASPRG